MYIMNKTHVFMLVRDVLLCTGMARHKLISRKNEAVGNRGPVKFISYLVCLLATELIGTDRVE